MNYKEKADELFDKISWAMVPDGQSIRTSGIIKHAKRCTIICVEQIIAELNELRKPEYTTFIIEYSDPDVPGDPGKNMDGYEKLDYWKEVLEHLKKS